MPIYTFENKKTGKVYDDMMSIAEKEKFSAVQLAEEKLKNTISEELTNKDKEIIDQLGSIICN